MLKYNIYGRKLSEPYDWALDPNHYKEQDNEGIYHVPKNRCYHCGIRFMNSKYAAYCNVCDNEMSPLHEEQMFVVTRYDPLAKPPVREGYWTTRSALIKNRIRIPDDVDEKEYQKKLNDLALAEQKISLSPKPEFKTAMQQAKEESDAWMQKNREEHQNG